MNERPSCDTSFNVCSCTLSTNVERPEVFVVVDGSRVIFQPFSPPPEGGGAVSLATSAPPSEASHASATNLGTLKMKLGDYMEREKLFLRPHLDEPHFLPGEVEVDLLGGGRQPTLPGEGTHGACWNAGRATHAAGGCQIHICTACQRCVY